jgi:methylated-DNA-[protein]-cysteine S-methyltransferase
MPEMTIQSPLGALTLTEAEGALTRLRWGGQGDDHTELLGEAADQLAAYFGRRLTSFTLPLAPKVSAGQRRFLAALEAIPYGETRTYGELARDLGISAQAAGQGCGANPLPILIPCHRVLGTGNLGGFSAPGGVETKVSLLKLEGAASLLI